MMYTHLASGMHEQLCLVFRGSPDGLGVVVHAGVEEMECSIGYCVYQVLLIASIR